MAGMREVLAELTEEGLAARTEPVAEPGYPGSKASMPPDPGDARDACFDNQLQVMADLADLVDH